MNKIWSQAYQNILWSKPGSFNVGYNVLNRALINGFGRKPALFWENDQGLKETVTYSQLNTLANRFANYLIKSGFENGNKLFTYLPRLPLIYYGLIGALKAGAVIGTLFPALATPALAERLINSQAEYVLTNPDLYPRLQPLLKKLPKLKKIIVADADFYRLLNDFNADFNPVPKKPDEPLIMLFTSATGNTPVSGIVLSQEAFVQQYYTGRVVLGLTGKEKYWCTADPGWVTGLVYGILIPLSYGNPILVYEGRFNAQKWLDLLSRYRINIMYTAPTALRMLQAEEPNLKKVNSSNLKRIYSVGEALPPNTASWVNDYFKVPIYDTWWQTECGAIMITNRPGLPVKLGSMGQSLPGIQALIVNNRGQLLSKNKIGHLAIIPPWPGMMIDIWQNVSLYRSYFRHRFYYSGDLAYQDEEDYFWFVGRSNDVIKTSGERVGPFEVESALNNHPAVLESAVIGKPDPLRGQIIKAFLVIRSGYQPTENLITEIQRFVKQELAGHAYPREIEFVTGLPKNRSGKIVRRILRNKEMGLPLGDSSTLED